LGVEQWLKALAEAQPVAHAVLALCVAGVAGLALGSVRVQGIGLGTAGILFAGIVLGHFGVVVDHQILDFVREFGLILFVFTIGLQLGPGFFASLRKDGLRLNVLAAVVVLSGVGLAWGFGELLGVARAARLGIFSGATTNTPSLGAGQQALRMFGVTGAERDLPALAYAVAYPVGIAGIIGTLLLVKLWFRINPEEEAAQHAAERKAGVAPLKRRNLDVVNPNLEGIPLGEVPGRRELRVAVSRIRKAGAEEVLAATDDTVLGLGDTILVVGTERDLDQFQRVVGVRSTADLMRAPGRVGYERLVVTNKAALGRTIDELGLDVRFGAGVTRVTRADVEMAAVPDLRLQFGDQLQVVGDAEALKAAALELGNSVKELNATHFIPIFLGIALGVAAGLIPMHLPGMPVPVRLGMAGGPLLLAIILARVGRIGPVIWHMPVNANLAVRELGISLFLACVGIKAGGRFMETVFTRDGLIWLAAAALVAVVPLVVVAFYARAKLRMNYMTLSGLMSGSMTDPPALAFASGISKSDAPTLAYATVYPLTMILRILGAQMLAMVLFR
jgi:putative transport protein